MSSFSITDILLLFNRNSFKFFNSFNPLIFEIKLFSNFNVDILINNFNPLIVLILLLDTSNIVKFVYNYKCFKHVNLLPFKFKDIKV